MAVSTLFSAKNLWPITHQKRSLGTVTLCAPIQLHPNTECLYPRYTQGLHCIPGSHPSDSWAWCPQQQDGPAQETGRAMMLQRNWSKTSHANRACLNREEPRKFWHWPLVKISGADQKIFFNSKATRGLNLWRILVFKDYSRKEHLEDFWVAE